LGALDDAAAAQSQDVGRDWHLHGPRRQYFLATPATDASRKLEAAGAKALCEKDTVELGQDIIHSVTNPIGRLTGAIHIYGGDFFGVQRSEWDAETFLEQPCDGDKMLRRFEQANALLRKNRSMDA
jgi:predicted metal-dependent enzyme (double-stranded beta helix superfamily)